MPPAPAPAPGQPTDAVRPPVALYVHIPFCVSHCPYCDFVVYAGSAARGPAARIDAFVGALLIELELRADALDAQFGDGRAPLETLYLGGGTPSMLPASSIAAILDTVRRRYGLAAGAEVTLEANPSPDERGDFSALVAAGVNRVSFGAQSMDAAELRTLGRRHSPEDVGTAVAGARAAGIGSVNLDLLYDVPGQSLESWRATLETALSLGPDHLSLYALTLDEPDEEGITGPLGDHLPTPRGARQWRARAREEQDDDRAAEQYAAATAELSARGWHGYEISNWARPGHESRHNLAYWRRLPYEAVGPGAHAFDGATRRWNAARLDRYLAALAGPGSHLPPSGDERLTEADASAEMAILALRLDAGLPASWLAAAANGSSNGPSTAASNGPSNASPAAIAAALEWGLDAGLLERATIDREPRIRLSLRGRLLSNELFQRFL